jgi:hypothetical protein
LALAAAIGRAQQRTSAGERGRWRRAAMSGGKRMAFLERRDGGGIGERRRGCQKRGGGGRLWAVNCTGRRLVVLPRGTAGHIAVTTTMPWTPPFACEGAAGPAGPPLRHPAPAGRTDGFEQDDGNREVRGRGGGGLATY